MCIYIISSLKIKIFLMIFRFIPITVKKQTNKTNRITNSVFIFISSRIRNLQQFIPSFFNLPLMEKNICFFYNIRI